MKSRLTFAALLSLAALITPLPAGASLSVPSVVAAMNDSRAEAEIGALKEDAALAAIAQKKASDMAQRGYFSHATPEGRSPWWWLVKGGYAYERAGENLAINFLATSTLEAAWMASPGHRANILERSFDRVGVGVATGTYKGTEALFVVAYYAQAPHPARALFARGLTRTGALE
jgi:uncharacterized protein YkwD